MIGNYTSSGAQLVLDRNTGEYVTSATLRQREAAHVEAMARRARLSERAKYALAQGIREFGL